MEPYIGEFIGTALLLLLGSGVVANVLLDESKGKDAGWLVICWAWAIAVFLGVYSATALGGSGQVEPVTRELFLDFGNHPVHPGHDPSVDHAGLGGRLHVLALRLDQHEPSRVPELVAEIPVALDPAQVEPDIAPCRRQGGKRESKRIATVGLDAGRKLFPGCFCLWPPSGW